MLGSMRRASIAAFAALAFAGGVPQVLTQQPAMTSTAPRPVKAAKRIRQGAAYSSAGAYGRKGAGVSMAAQKRTARKARNVARNRRQHR